MSEILAHGLLWLDVLRDYHGSIRSHNFRRFVTEGGLISFGIDQAALYRLATSYVDRILKGEKPADLLVQAPTKWLRLAEIVFPERTPVFLSLFFFDNSLSQEFSDKVGLRTAFFLTDFIQRDDIIPRHSHFQNCCWIGRPTTG